MIETSLSLLELAGRNGDAKAWRRLEEIYAPLLRSWLRRQGVSDTDADDLVQEVLLAVSRSLPQFEHVGRAGAFRSWLRRTLVFRLRDFWRSRDYRPVAPGGTSWGERLDQLADDGTALSREWDRAHDEFAMSRLLEQVRPRFEARTWEAFRRQVLEGERADRVAAELGLSLNSVYVARSRVLKTLRQEAAGLIDD
jgi:RNA polymerase sigma-70 factor (ECF subfamily)